MTLEQIRKAHQARPFVPFALRLADGREYGVRHPETLAIIPPGRTIIVADREESFEVIDLLLVASLHFGNGRARNSSRRPRGV